MDPIAAYLSVRSAIEKVNLYHRVIKARTSRGHSCCQKCLDFYVFYVECY